jgi:hypothetical protein
MKFSAAGPPPLFQQSGLPFIDAHLLPLLSPLISLLSPILQPLLGNMPFLSQFIEYAKLL